VQRPRRFLQLHEAGGRARSLPLISLSAQRTFSEALAPASVGLRPPRCMKPQVCSGVAPR
jgi:hypothetical protein